MRVLRWSTRPVDDGDAQLASRGAKSVCCDDRKCQEAVRKVASQVVVVLAAQARDETGLAAALSVATRPFLRVPSRAATVAHLKPLHQLWHMATRGKPYADRRIQTALDTWLPCYSLRFSYRCHGAPEAAHVAFIVLITACICLLTPQLNIACPTEAKYRQHRPRPCVPALLHERQCSAFVSVKTTRCLRQVLR
jgi:hypothetical protein